MDKKFALQFNLDGKFKIMIITDVHTGKKLDSYTRLLMDLALDQEKPDLVVLLGDNIMSIDPVLFISKENTKTAINNLLDPIIKRNIPFCVVMGNHDSEGAFSRKDQMEYYMSFPGSLSQIGENDNRVGDYNVVIRSSDSLRNVINLWFMDSGESKDTYTGNGYTYITEEQITWYEKRCLDLKERNDDQVIPALLFEHIPVSEIYETLKIVPKDTKDAIHGHRSHSDNYYVIDTDKVRSGTMEEAPCSSDTNTGQFASWLNQGDVMAAFFGHDHVNDFDGEYQGIRLIYTSGAGFNTYGKAYEHGVRVIELDENDITNFSTRMVYWKDLTDKQIPGHLQAMGELVFRCLIIGGFVLITSVMLIIRRIIKRRKNKILLKDLNKNLVNNE